MKTWISWGNGVRVIFCDASDDIPDIAETVSATGLDGKIYRNGIFDRQIGGEPDVPSHIFVVHVEAISSLH